MSQKNMMIKLNRYCKIIIWIIIPICCFSQNDNTIAADLVKADYFDFQTNPGTVISAKELHLAEKGYSECNFILIKNRNLIFLKRLFSKEILGSNKKYYSFYDFDEQTFLSNYIRDSIPLDSINSVTFYENQLHKQGIDIKCQYQQNNYLLAKVGNKFYRLRGFRSNEFDIFFHSYLFEKLGRDTSKRRIIKELKRLSTEEIDLYNMYLFSIKKRKHKGCDSHYYRSLNALHCPAF